MSEEQKKTGSNNDATDGKNKHDSGEKPTFSAIQEGSITMKYPADEESTVFYNPVQVQNRDLSILMLSLYAERRTLRHLLAIKKKELRKAQPNKKLSKEERSEAEKAMQQQLDEYQAQLTSTPSSTDGGDTTTSESLLLTKMNSDSHKKEDGMCILDALAASGLRSMRYWKEIPGVKHVTINDLDPAAVERAHMNIQENGLTNALVSSNNNKNEDDLCWQRPHGIQVQNGDAKMEMYLSQRSQKLSTVLNPQLVHQSTLKPQWDVIDLDPYGSAAPFLDAAVQAIESGGMLCITCTDMAALGGSHPETCYGRYASMPIPNARYLQEAALRILLGTIATTAAKYGRTMQPILSVGMNFYIRVFVEVKDDKAGVRMQRAGLGLF